MMENKPCPQDWFHFHLMIVPEPGIYPALELKVTLDKAFLDAIAAASYDEDDKCLAPRAYPHYTDSQVGLCSQGVI